MNTAIAKPPVINMRYLLIGLFMCTAAVLALALTPKQRVADQGPKIDLETMIPKKFGDWRVDESIVPLQVSPDVQAKLSKIYNQTLSRTYINSRGESVMLSVAYGSDQSDSMQVHKPEVCYPAQGFQVLSQYKSVMQINSIEIPVKRLVAKQSSRIEPITYWITVGEEAVTGGVDRKIAQIRYGLTGKVPDGMLVRISNISSNEDASFRLHDIFALDLYRQVESKNRRHVFGVSAPTIVPGV